MTQIGVREYREGDKDAVLTVLRLALGEGSGFERTHELWDWKHTHNPFGRSLVWVATVEGQLAGVRALMRWRLVTPSGEAIECVRPVDTATHPGFLRRGIFQNLTLAAIEHAKDAGIQLIFNTPNSKSKPGYIKMGWQEVGAVDVLVRPSLRWLVDRPDEDRRPYLDSVVASSLENVKDRPALGLRTPRGVDYLEWRYQRHPSAVYSWLSTQGTHVFARSNKRRGRSELVLSDVLGANPAAGYRAAGRAHRAQYMITHASKGTPERRAALRSGLAALPGLKALSLVAKPLVELPVDVSELRSWDISLGDLELL